MKHVLAASLALCIIAFAPTIARADITRGCEFVIFSSNPAFSPTHRTLATIKTQGACQNRAKANQCRSRAYNSGKSCANDLWGARWTHTVPQSCKNLSGARTGARLQWNGIFPKLPNGNNSFKDRIEYEACCRTDGLKSTGTVHVRWLATGNKGCGPNRTGSKSFYGGGNFATDYGVNCTALIQAGLCGTPTRTNN